MAQADARMWHVTTQPAYWHFTQTDATLAASRQHGHDCHDQPSGDRAARRPPGREPREKTMIFHINRATYKADLSEEQRRTGVEMLRQSGAANPAVKSYVVGPELGGEFEYNAVYVFEDLDGYWAYLNHPAHVSEELWGIPHLEKFAAIDVSDSDDPKLSEKIAALQARHLQEQPEIAALVAQSSSFTVPHGDGQRPAAD
jgi:hypothetical protein